MLYEYCMSTTGLREDSVGSQGNGLARTLLRALEETLQQAGVLAVTIPAIIAAADEARLPAPAPTPGATLSGLPSASLHHASDQALAAPAGKEGGHVDLPLSSPASAALSHHTTPGSICSAAWGCKVRLYSAS